MSETIGAPFSNPTTSKDAAQEIAPHVARLQAVVLAALPGTSDAIEARLGLPHQTVSARLKELADKRLAFDSGRREKTRSGRSAIVWTVEKLPEPARGALGAAEAAPDAAEKGVGEI